MSDAGAGKLEEAIAVLRGRIAEVDSTLKQSLVDVISALDSTIASLTTTVETQEITLAWLSGVANEHLDRIEDLEKMVAALRDKHGS